ncbi:reverse transcriptase domain-containing protein [Tanacetum coccineum]
MNSNLASTSYSQPELPRFITNPHNNDTQSVDELARDKAGEDNDVREDNQQSGGDYRSPWRGIMEEVARMSRGCRIRRFCGFCHVCIMKFIVSWICGIVTFNDLLLYRTVDLANSGFDETDSKLSHGLRACPEKADTVLSLPSPRCIKDVQKLNGKLASLNRFLSKSAEKSLPFFKTLKKCTKKSDFQWTPEAEEAFKQMKKLIAELPTLTAPREHEELIIYLAAAKEAISAVLMTDREGRQIPVYFVSRTLRGPEVNYTPM